MTTTTTIRLADDFYDNVEMFGYLMLNSLQIHGKKKMFLILLLEEVQQFL